MKLIALVCNHCGGSLDICADIEFVTCRYCEAISRVEQVGDEMQLSLIKEAKDLRKQVSENKLSIALDNLDKAWANKEEYFAKRLGRTPTQTLFRIFTVLLVLSIIGLVCSIWYTMTASSIILRARGGIAAILLGYTSIYVGTRCSSIFYWYKTRARTYQTYLAKREELIHHYSSS